MITSFNSAEIFAYEPSLHKYFFRQPSLDATPTCRLDLLYSCLITTKKLANGYLARPLCDFAGVSVIDLAHLGRCLSTLLKLSLLEDAGWDLVHVRRTADLSYYFNETSARFASVGAEIDDQQKRIVRERATSFPTGCARAMKMVQNWYEARLAAEGNNAAAGGETAVVREELQVQGTGIGAEDVSMEEAFDLDYLNDANWLDIMGDYGFNTALY